MPSNPPGTLAFIDLETTSVRPDRRAWEVAVIVARPDQPTVEQFHCFVNVDDLDLGEADARALQVGRFHDRHPQMRPLLDATIGLRQSIGVLSEEAAMARVEELTRGAQLVAWNVAFDAETLDARMRWHGISPSFDYHHIEISSYAAGWLDFGTVGEQSWRPQIDPNTGLRRPLWTLYEVLTGLGINIDVWDRHTALGDAAMVQQIWNVISTANREGREELAELVRQQAAQEQQGRPADA